MNKTVSKRVDASSKLVCLDLNRSQTSSSVQRPIHSNVGRRTLHMQQLKYDVLEKAVCHNMTTCKVLPSHGPRFCLSSLEANQRSARVCVCVCSNVSRAPNLPHPPTCNSHMSAPVTVYTTRRNTTSSLASESSVFGTDTD